MARKLDRGGYHSGLDLGNLLPAERSFARMSNNQTAIRPGRPDVDFAELSLVTTSVLALVLIAMYLPFVALEKGGEVTRDFVVYWATGQQLVHRGDPYDPVALERIEHIAGFPAGYGAFYMRNPPWALLLALPLGLANLNMAAFVWSLVLLGCQAISGWLIWIMHGRPPNRIYLLPLSFAPSLTCLFMGQTALFALLGLTLFYWLHKSQPFAAGLALWLCSLKPHLFLPFGIVLLVWLIVSRNFRIVAGATLALGASCLAVHLIDPAAWAGYSKIMHAPTITMEPIPCLSVAMRLWISPPAIWLQYLPTALASCWAVIYYWRNRGTWNWVKNGSLLILVSIVTAPYCWIYDQGLALPALLDRADAIRSRSLLAVLTAFSALIMIGILCGLKITSSIFLLPAPIWLVWYLVAKTTVSENPAGPELSSALIKNERKLGDSSAEKTQMDRDE